MMPGIVISFCATLLYLRFYYRNLKANEFDEPNKDLENGNYPSVSFKKVDHSNDPIEEAEETSPLSYQNGEGPSSPSSDEEYTRYRKTTLTLETVDSTRKAHFSPTVTLLNPDSSDEPSEPSSPTNNISATDKLLESLNKGNLEEFCGTTLSMKDVIFDERRVVGSSEGELKWLFSVLIQLILLFLKQNCNVKSKYGNGRATPFRAILVMRTVFEQF